VSQFPSVLPSQMFDTAGMVQLARNAAKLSFDYTFQCGVVLGRQSKLAEQYIYMAHAFNKVVPYQTFAMQHGSVREAHYSPVNDLNFYDAVHAEVMLMLEAQKRGLDLTGTTVFINLLSCPQCSRMFTQTDIKEVVYREDHSDGYAISLLEMAGKTVRRHPAAV
jgi:deoxycytidylate deaminase